jgi:hypothetical protein
MNIGESIVITEAVLVFDEHGHDLLIAGTEGTITAIEGGLLSLKTAKGVLYDSIPINCTKSRTEGKAA